MSEDPKARYLSFLCNHCGFWLDGQVSGRTVFCPQCGTPAHGDAETALPAAPPAGHGTRVLVAEDSSMLRKAIVRLLTALGCDVKETADGRAAIAALDWQPHVVLTDIEMPGANGIDVLKAVRARADLRSIPVVVLTGHADARIVADALAHNVMAYLLKDRVSSKDLKRKLQQVLVAAQLLAQQGASRRVLVADDSDTFRNAVVRMLRGLNCEVLEAADGQQALDIIAARMPDLVLSDLQMPNMTGLELLTRVRDLPGGDRLPFIVITSQGQGETMAQAMELGVVAYILKDQVDPARLREQVETCLTAAAALA